MVAPRNAPAGKVTISRKLARYGASMMWPICFVSVANPRSKLLTFTHIFPRPRF
jgi:hypothetical protein